MPANPHELFRLENSAAWIVAKAGSGSGATLTLQLTARMLMLMANQRRGHLRRCNGACFGVVRHDISTSRRRNQRCAKLRGIPAPSFHWQRMPPR